MKRLLNETQRQAIADAVAAAEQKTRAEIVTVLAPAADDYREFAFLAGAILALLLAAVIAVVESAWAAPEWLGLLPVMALFAALPLGVLLRWPPLLRRLVPAAVRHRRAAALARAQFLAQNLHHTRGETGVLLFVAEFERYVEVLVDRGVATHVPDSAWQELVAEFTRRVKDGEVEAGFTGALSRCGDLLAAPLPPDNDNPNELPNRLILLD